MYTIRDLIKYSTAYLENQNISHARREAEELLAALLKWKRMELYFHYDTPLKEKEVSQYREWIKRRGIKEPLAYIVGEVKFLDLKLKVNPAVLIPRHETEILADLVLKRLPEGALEVWDVCTGTGCLGLAVKNRHPAYHVYLGDISSEALKIAKMNAERNDLEVELLKGDLLTPFQGKKADVVICNPPYITSEEYESLEKEVRGFEPREALVGGLDFYKRLAKDLPAFLRRKAKVFFEIGAGQGAALMKIFSANAWVHKKCEKDWSGNDRFFFLEYDKNFQ